MPEILPVVDQDDIDTIERSVQLAVKNVSDSSDKPIVIERLNITINYASGGGAVVNNASGHNAVIGVPESSDD